MEKTEIKEWEEFRILELLKQRKNTQDHVYNTRTSVYLKHCISDRLDTYMDWDIGFSSLGKFQYKLASQDMLLATY